MCRYSCGQTSLVDFKQPVAVNLRTDNLLENALEASLRTAPA